MYLKKNSCLKIVGPEITSILKNEKKWSNVIKQTKKIKYDQ